MGPNETGIRIESDQASTLEKSASPIRRRNYCLAAGEAKPAVMAVRKILKKLYQFSGRATRRRTISASSHTASADTPCFRV